MRFLYRSFGVIFLFLLFIEMTLAVTYTSTPFLTIGEKLVYEGSAPRLGPLGKKIGKVTLSISEDVLVSGAKCFKIDLHLEMSKSVSGLYKYGSAISSVIDSAQFRSLIYYKNDQKSDEGRFEKAIIDYDGSKIYYRKYGTGKAGHAVEIANPYRSIIDPLSLIFYFRAMEFKGQSGQTQSFNLFNRAKITQVAVSFQRIQSEIFGQKKEVIHIRPSEATKGTLISKRDVELFLDPKTHIPLLIRIIGIPIVGKLDLELIEANHPLLQMTSLD